MFFVSFDSYFYATSYRFVNSSFRLNCRFVKAFGGFLRKSQGRIFPRQLLYDVVSVSTTGEPG
jgi:hypothetical protein